jgi:hypothetical protein
MQFDNRQAIIKLNKRRYLSFIFYTLGLIFLFFSDWFEKPVLGIEKPKYVIAISILYILYIGFIYIINNNFFSFCDENDTYVFKFVSLRPFDSEKKSIVLQKDYFRGIKIQESFFNFKKELIVFAETRNGVVSYPPVSISALSKSHILILKKLLVYKS